MGEREVSLGWNKETVPMHTHACYYYSDEDTLRSSLEDNPFYISRVVVPAV